MTTDEKMKAVEDAIRARSTHKIWLNRLPKYLEKERLHLDAGIYEQRERDLGRTLDCMEFDPVNHAVERFIAHMTLDDAWANLSDSDQGKFDVNIKRGHQ